MKNVYLSSPFIAFSPSSYRQIIKTGCYRGQFGIDAETLAGYTKFGAAPSPNLADYWFYSLSGKGRIYTTNTAFYKLQFHGNNNISFAQRMSIPVFIKLVRRGGEKTTRKII